MSVATQRNREVYDALWPHLSDYIRHHPGARHRRRKTLELVGASPFSSLLDVGCGNAAWLREVDAHWPGKKLTGVDLSDVVIRQNQRDVTHIRFATMDVASAPIVLEDRVDVITCCEVLEHLDNPGLALRHMTHALAPRGRIIVTTPHGPVFATEKHFGHVAHPTLEDLQRWANAAGLHVVSAQCWGYPTYRLLKHATNLRADAALQRFASDRRYSLVDRAVCELLYRVTDVGFRSHPRGVQWFVVLQHAKETHG
jgi:2-polyprenyl-3-methyl-5-hydroxy-6-metoxy-1,4-benzoquinol methylase